MSYPSTLDSFTQKTDNFDTIRADHINLLQNTLVAIETELGTDPAGNQTDLKTRLAKSLSDAGHLKMNTSAQLTIASGVITITQNWHTIQAESGTTDELVTINGGADGMILFIRPVSGRTIILKHNTGNIICPESVDVSLTTNLCMLVYDATLSKWLALLGGRQGVNTVKSMIPLATKLTNASWNGSTISIGTTNINANTFNSAIPTSAVALLMSVSARFTTAGDGNLVKIYPQGASGNCLLVRAQVANYFQDANGVVPLDGSGNFSVTVAGGSAVVYLEVWGYVAPVNV